MMSSKLLPGPSAGGIVSDRRSPLQGPSSVPLFRPASAACVAFCAADCMKCVGLTYLLRTAWLDLCKCCQPCIVCVALPCI